MNAPTVKVRVTSKSGTYMARAGFGAKAKTASYTGGYEGAARRAAAKAFCLDECNTQTAAEIVLTRLGSIRNAANNTLTNCYEATLPAQQS